MGPEPPADAPGPDDGNGDSDGVGETDDRDSAGWLDSPLQGLGGGMGSGGATSSGGNTGSGGATSTGGTGYCGATPSTLSRTYSFAAGLGSLIPNNDSIPGARLSFVTSGPASNPGLCSSTSGCAALSVPYSAGTSAMSGWVTAYVTFSPRANLVGATVTLTVAVENSGDKVPIQILAFATGDASTNYSQTVPTAVSGSNLTAYAPARGWNTISVVVTDHTGNPGVFCASSTAFIGLEVQNTSAITSANAGTVTAYISSMTVAPPI
jgi:hypothetical protein